jgi:hypothetical protein
MPLSLCFKFAAVRGIQLFIFIVFFGYYYYKDADIFINEYTVSVNGVIMDVGFGIGMIISAMVANTGFKYFSGSLAYGY